MKKYGIASQGKKTPKWTDEELRNVVANSKSFAEVLRRIDLQPRGGNYQTIKRAIANLKLSTDHFLGCGANKGKPSGRGLPLDEYLVLNGPPIASTRLKNRLLREKRIKEECAICGLGPTWKGKPLKLRLDHIHGDRVDNRIEHLRLVCPNCDSQLPTFCGRNINRTGG